MGSGKRIELLEVLAVFILGLLLRVYAGRNSIQGGNVLFFGPDDFYHMRRAIYTVAHFPNTIWFDSYIDYPHGANITWPPLWDQLIAGSSLALGQHSQHGIEMMGAVLPIIIGSMAIIVVYLFIREIFGRNVALMSALMTALAPFFLRKTMLGATDHHGLEVLLCLSMVMFLILSLTSTNRRLIFAAASGISMAALAYTWAGANAYFGVILIYFAVQITVDLKQNMPPSKEVYIVILTSFVIAFILTLPFWNRDWMSSSFLGLGIMTLATISLFGLSRAIYDRKVHWIAFPAIVIGLAGIFIIITHIFGNLPAFQKIDSLIISGGDYIFSGSMIGMIAEAEPIFSHTEYIFYNKAPTTLGWNVIFSIIALAILIKHLQIAPRNGQLGRGQLLFLVFAGYSLILTIGQIRFLYLSSVTMGILISILFFKVYENIFQVSDIRNERFKFLLPLLFLVLVLPTAIDDISYLNSRPPAAGDWQESLKWLEQNSKTTSYFDDPYKSPEYGLMLWWDYGNWALYESRRPVVANNFQLGAEDAASFFLSENETAATAILDNRSSRYVITDYDMLFSKMGAIALWAKRNISDYLILRKMGMQTMATPTSRMKQTTLSRLYVMDGSEMSRFRLIYESPTSIGGDGTPIERMVKIFEYVPGAVIRVATQPDQMVGVRLNMTSNQGRPFAYVNEGVLQASGYEIRVPYSTEKKYDTHATGPYLVFSGNSAGNLKHQLVNVTEEDIMKGNIIEIRI